MRLTTEQVHLIKATIARELDPRARVWLFGSRVDDTRKGGDVDLYVETERAELMRELRCKLQLQEALDLHVDLIAAPPGRDHPLGAIVRSEGIAL